MAEMSRDLADVLKILVFVRLSTDEISRTDTEVCPIVKRGHEEQSMNATNTNHY